jgi:HAD superfamily hydrolase (TIGR01509 family)
MANSTRAIFFDLGGTLFSNKDIPRVNGPVLMETARRLGVEGGFGEIGMAYVRAAREVNDRYMRRSYYLHRDHFYDTYRLFVTGLDREVTDEFLDWLYAAQREAMVTGLRLRDDCVATLQALRERGLTLSIVSNIDDDYLSGMLRNLGLEPLFDHWLSSQAARSCKPDRGIFEAALRQADCRADEVVFVGDSRIHDIAGARAAGMTAVLLAEEGGVSHLDDFDFDAEPDFVVTQLGELLPLVAGGKTPGAAAGSIAKGA